MKTSSGFIIKHALIAWIIITATLAAYIYINKKASNIIKEGERIYTAEREETSIYGKNDFVVVDMGDFEEVTVSRRRNK